MKPTKQATKQATQSTGANRPRYDAAMERRRSSATTPIDHRHPNRTQAKRSWQKEQA